MATNEDDGVGRPNDHEELQQARFRARGAKRQLRNELIRQAEANRDTKLKAAEVALDYRDLLIDYRADLGIEKWERADVDWLSDYVGEHVTRQQEKPGLNRGTESVAVPKLAVDDGEDLYEALKNLDKIWRTLGFGADINEDEVESFEVGDAE